MTDLADAIGIAILVEDDGTRLDPDDPTTALDLLRRAAAADRIASELLQQTVTSARSNGHSWAAIGKALGLTRQAAQQRFGRGEPADAVPTDGAPEERWLGPVTAFNEMAELAIAGDLGWRTVGANMLCHRMVRTSTKWEHKRIAWPTAANRFEADGWQIAVRVFPWIYLVRDTGVSVSEGRDT